MIFLLVAKYFQYTRVNLNLLRCQFFFFNYLIHVYFSYPCRIINVIGVNLLVELLKYSVLLGSCATLWVTSSHTTASDKIIFRKTIIRRPSQSDHGSSSLYFGLLTHNYRCSGFPLQHLHFGVNIIFQTSKYYTVYFFKDSS